VGLVYDRNTRWVVRFNAPARVTASGASTWRPPVYRVTHANRCRAGAPTHRWPGAEGHRATG
jgi:hypothetical protein